MSTPPRQRTKSTRVKAHLAFVVALFGLMCGLGGYALFYAVRWGLHRESLVRLDPVGTIALDARLDGLADGDLLLIGDSRLAELPMPEDVQGRRVVDLALPGATSAQAAIVLQVALQKCKPSMVVIQVGVNDLKAAGYGMDAEALTTGLIEHVGSMVEMAARVGSPALITAIVPPGQPPALRRLFWPRDFSGLVVRANQLLEAAVAEQPGAAFWRADLPWEFRDALHLDDDTNQLLGERLSAELARRLGATPDRSP